MHRPRRRPCTRQTYRNISGDRRRLTAGRLDDRINGYFLGNGRLTWKSGEDDWSLSAEVQNIFNKYYYTSLYEQYASPGTISGAPGMPRTFALTVKRNF